MNKKHWHPPHPGNFPHPQANQQMQYCRDCGQYHPIQQPDFPPQQAMQPNFHTPRQPGFEHPAEQQQFNNQHLPEEQPLPEWNRRINMIEAINIALDQVPGEPVEAELKREQGRLIYEIEIVNQQGVRYEVEVDVNTGNVLSVGLD